MGREPAGRCPFRQSMGYSAGDVAADSVVIEKPGMRARDL